MMRRSTLRSCSFRRLCMHCMPTTQSACSFCSLRGRTLTCQWARAHARCSTCCASSLSARAIKRSCSHCSELAPLSMAATLMGYSTPGGGVGWGYKDAMFACPISLSWPPTARHPPLAARHAPPAIHHPQAQLQNPTQHPTSDPFPFHPPPATRCRALRAALSLTSAPFRAGRFTTRR